MMEPEETKKILGRYVEAHILVDPDRLLRLTDEELGKKFCAVVQSAWLHREANTIVNTFDPPTEEGS